MTEDGPKIGMFGDISNHDYHFGPGISKSGLDLINRSPLHYITQKQHPKPSTKALEIGAALHCLVLEPDVFATEYVKEPTEAPKRPTSAQINAKKPSAATLDAIAYWEAWRAENEGKTVITDKAGDSSFWSPGDWTALHNMRDAVMSHPYASILLDPTQGAAEQTVYWIDETTRKLCKCRPDFLNNGANLIVDLKTTEDARESEFAKSCAKFRYNVQSAYYQDGLRAIGMPVTSFAFVAVEKTPPYSVGVYMLDKEDVRIGRAMYEVDLETYAKCHAANEWPSYPPEIRELSIPGWGRVGKVS